MTGAKLIAAKDREIARLNAIYRRLLDNAGATIFDARAVLLDPHTLDVGGQRVTAEQHRHRHRRPSGARADSPAPNSASSPTTRSTCRRCRERIAVCGSGYIAVEFAGIFQALGAEAHLVYRQPLPLRGFDHDMREALAEALAAQGVIAASRQPPAERWRPMASSAS